MQFTTENSIGICQRVLPTEAVVLEDRQHMVGKVGTFDPGMVVHGEQAITLHREIPVEGELESISEIDAIYDKGSGALVVIETMSKLFPTDEPLFTTRTALFIRGEGGWGGDRGPSGMANQPPDRAPDTERSYATRVDQALLYQLCGDRNPLHSDPAFAAKSGFDRPILHGLCTFGFTGRALLHDRCAGDPSRFLSMAVRFSATVTPGETLTVQMWDIDPGSVAFRTVGEDGRAVIDGGRFTCKR
jgi:acyl dehydratase